MLHFLIGLAFLLLLLIPIGFFLMSLVYATGAEMRKKASATTSIKRALESTSFPVREKIRIVK